MEFQRKSDLITDHNSVHMNSEISTIHVTSNPHFQSSNGATERAVETVKRLFRKTVDKQLALLDYRMTPLEEVNLHTSQLFMGKKPSDTLPSDILRPKSQNLDIIKQSLHSVKDNQKASFDNKFKGKELLPLYPTDSVRIMTQQGRKEWIQYLQ